MAGSSGPKQSEDNMKKLDRKPEYHKEFPLRIVSKPNGLFAVQANHRPEDFRSNTVDKWQDCFGASALSYDAAKLRMQAETSK